MSQVNVNEPEPGPFSDESPGTAAARSLMWAIAAVIVIAALVMAILYLAQSLHP